jgi:hypothetical protein
MNVVANLNSVENLFLSSDAKLELKKAFFGYVDILKLKFKFGSLDQRINGKWTFQRTKKVPSPAHRFHLLSTQYCSTCTR